MLLLICLDLFLMKMLVKVRIRVTVILAWILLGMMTFWMLFFPVLRVLFVMILVWRWCL